MNEIATSGTEDDRDGGGTSSVPFSPERVTSGLIGLDQVLNGGLIPRRRYLIRGGPGTGKTTLGLTFLTADSQGASLFIGFQEPEEELRTNARNVGIDVSGVHFLSLGTDQDFFAEGEAYDVFGAGGAEQAPMTKSVVDVMNELRPKRVFVDSLSQMRFLTADLAQFRKQVISFLRFLVDCGATVVFTSESTKKVPDDDLQFICDGIFELEQMHSGGTLTVRKFRGSAFFRGMHQFRMDQSGFALYPRMMPPSQPQMETADDQLSSGNDELDGMLHGGLEAGTVSLFTGPTGIGKSTLAGMFAAQAARSGKRAAVYQFEEELHGWLTRLRSLGVGVDEPYREGTLILDQIEQLRYLPDEFTNAVYQRVIDQGIKLVVLDSVSGFHLALGSEDDSSRSLHALVKTLSRHGVGVILIKESRAVIGAAQISESDISYLSDNVIYLRYQQYGDTLKKVIGVLKKRWSEFDNRQHLFEAAKGRIRITRLNPEMNHGTGPRGLSGDPE